MGKYSPALGANTSSTCTSCVAGKYAYMPLVLSSGLIAVNSGISDSTLQQWAAAGVREWKMGGGGQSCSTVCSNFELQCHSLSISEEDTIALLSSLGVQYGNVDLWDTTDKRAPMCTTQWCYHYKGDPECSSDPWSTIRRLCACRSSSVMLTYRDEGVSTCSDCVAGKYLATDGNYDSTARYKPPMAALSRNDSLEPTCAQRAFPDFYFHNTSLTPFTLLLGVKPGRCHLDAAKLQNMQRPLEEPNRIF
jgi:hypothetical protein